MTTTFKEVEAARQAYLKKIHMYCLACGIGLVIAMIVGIWQIMAPLWVLAFYLILTSKENAAYRKAYKDYFVERNLRSVFEVARYGHALGLNKSILDAVGMIDTGDRYSSNDYVAGCYKDTNFLQADVHIETMVYTGKNIRYHTTFRGRWMIFEFPKKFNFKLEVIENGFRAARIPKKGSGFERIEVESSEFNRLFKVYAEDGFETFYLLDPSLIDNITKLGEAYKGQMLLCFVDNKLHIGLHDNKDAFEAPGMFKGLDEAAENAKVTEEIRLITDFVDKLKLSKGIFQ